MEKEKLFEKVLRDFINYIFVEKGLSQNSISSYKRDIIKYLEYLKNIDIKSVDEVKRENITNYLNTRGVFIYYSCQICLFNKIFS